ncbi:hypothetical protein BJ986_000203 [Phycicoccus badiiscoriae]|uniref:Uncharacterized protein n=1 Tax=Pedococcus badiiscoriae TaxID=642776 RepID=A0A852WJK9_9MICO|nr:hypothetical protein [Pedococcus badiiscoriae]
MRRRSRQASPYPAEVDVVRHMVDSVTSPTYEPSAWLRERMARRVWELEHEGHGQSPFGRTVAPSVIVRPLGEAHSPGEGTREDRTCDRCGNYSPPGLRFHPLVLNPVPWLLLSGGLCHACHCLECPTCNGGASR